MCIQRRINAAAEVLKAHTQAAAKEAAQQPHQSQRVEGIRLAQRLDRMSLNLVQPRRRRNGSAPAASVSFRLMSCVRCRQIKAREPVNRAEPRCHPVAGEDLRDF